MKKKVFLTLSKITRGRLRDKKSALLSAQQNVDALQQKINLIEQGLQKEKEFILTHPHLQGLFQSYRKNTNLQQRERLQEKRKGDAELRRVQAKVNQLFQSAKSYEIPYERYQKQALKDQQAYEQKILDEAALGGFRDKLKPKEDF